MPLRLCFFISHRLNEVEAIAERVVVLRDGRNAGELAAGDIRRELMIGMMIGRDINRFYERVPPRGARPVLEFRDVATRAFPRARANLTVDVVSSLQCFAKAADLLSHVPAGL